MRKKTLLPVLLILMTLAVLPAAAGAAGTGAETRSIAGKALKAGKLSITDGIVQFATFYTETPYWLDPPDMLEIRFPDKHSADEISERYKGYRFKYYDYDNEDTFFVPGLPEADGTIISVKAQKNSVQIKYRDTETQKNNGVTIPFRKSAEVWIYTPLRVKLSQDCTYYSAPWTLNNETENYVRISREDFYSYYESWQVSDDGHAGGRVFSGDVDLYIKNNTICSMCISYFD